jgi:hypothetical protein
LLEARNLPEVHSLAKRDCTFVKSEGPYTKLVDYSEYVAGPFSCTVGGGCHKSITHEYSISRSISVGVSIGDPFGIISASLDVEFEESYSYSFTDQFDFAESTTGYVTSTPILQCWKGHYEGCDSDNNKDVEVCHVNPGEQKAVNSAVVSRAKKRAVPLEA